MADITSSQPQQRKGRFTKVPNRQPTKVDLTPMVDLGFLLITFFVLTTSMSQPTAMTLLETKDDLPRPVKQSGTMTIILGADHKIFYYQGIFDGQETTPFQQTDFTAIRSLILNKKKRTALEDLMYIIKADKMSSFGDNVNLLDEMAICNIPGGHYAEGELTEDESARMILSGGN